MRKLQEYLLQKDKPLEMAILPEDKIQRLLVGVTISVLLMASEFPPISFLECSISKFYLVYHRPVTN